MVRDSKDPLHEAKQRAIQADISPEALAERKEIDAFMGAAIDDGFRMADEEEERVRQQQS